MANPNQHARSGKGQYVRTPETARRDAQAADLRAKGWTYQKIADQLGYADKRTAYDAIERALKDIIREPGEAVLHFELQRLDAELVRLDDLEVSARKVLTNRHIMVNNGRVILHPETEQPMEDDGPVLQAIDRLIKIEDARRRNGERRAKLTGIEAAVKVDATVHEVTQQDLELQEMVREAEAAVAADRAKRESAGEG
jgi:transcriptional regulator with XRE-family HTH domain